MATIWDIYLDAADAAPILDAARPAVADLAARLEDDADPEG